MSSRATSASVTRSGAIRPGEQRDLDAKSFAGLALGLPLLGLLLHHRLGHEGDMRFFHDWYLAFREGASFYGDGPGLNYPILGVLVVCLPARAVEALWGVLDFETYRWVLKATLSVGEMLAIAAMASLAHTLKLPRPRMLALVVALSPAFWAPGALFGQIDVWGTSALLASCSALLLYRRSGSGRALLAGLLAMHGAILLKQLVVFTLPAVALLMLAGLSRHRRPGHVALAVASCLLLFVADAFIVLPAGYSSHIVWVLLGGGSAHADFIVAGGASLWSVVADINASAHEWEVLGVSAYLWGIALYLSAQLIALRSWWSRRGSDAALVVYAGLSNLAMVTLLTGVHERYLVHGAPLLLLGLAASGAGPRQRALLWAAVGIVSWWGVFVLASVNFEAFGGTLLVFRMHEPIAVLLLLLLLVMLTGWGSERSEERAVSP